MAHKMKGWTPFTKHSPGHGEVREMNEGEIALENRLVKEGIFARDVPDESKKVVDDEIYQNKNIGEILTKRSSQMKAMKEKAKPVKQ